jgi:hypothetical protein
VQLARLKIQFEGGETDSLIKIRSRHLSRIPVQSGYHIHSTAWFKEERGDVTAKLLHLQQLTRGHEFGGKK